jgi:hypothetical protein
VYSGGERHCGKEKAMKKIVHFIYTFGQAKTACGLKVFLQSTGQGRPGDYTTIDSHVTCKKCKAERARRRKMLSGV